MITSAVLAICAGAGLCIALLIVVLFCSHASRERAHWRICLGCQTFHNLAGGFSWTAPFGNGWYRVQECTDCKAIASLAFYRRVFGPEAKIIDSEKECPGCHGAGHVRTPSGAFECNRCAGSGIVVFLFVAIFSLNVRSAVVDAPRMYGAVSVSRRADAGASNPKSVQLRSHVHFCRKNGIQTSLINSFFVGSTPTPATNFESLGNAAVSLSTGQHIRPRCNCIKASQLNFDALAQGRNLVASVNPRVGMARGDNFAPQTKPESGGTAIQEKPRTIRGQSACPTKSDRPDRCGAISNFIDRLSWIESRSEDSAIGDGGKSRGRFQISEAAWADVNSLRRAQQLPEFDWLPFAHDEGTAREYALQFLGTLNRRLFTALGRSPTEFELIAAYQLGFDGFRRRGFNLARVPASTRVAIERLK